ncbi:MAG TPA: PA14 domain-containing protein [Pyrinomonadaceae bacterium]|nr:PA14 domain-containing protein [Pyrinomonadaceae bacterium]
MFLAIVVLGQTDSKNTKPKLIKGDVFIIEKTTTVLPKDFSKLPPITSIFVNEINVPTRAWNNGFPDLPEIYEWFAIEYTTTFRIGEDSNYKFRLISDDGAKLWVDKKLVVDNDGVHQFLPVGGSIKLAKGDHSFKLQFFQGPRYEAGIQLFVKKDSSKEALFPSDEIELIKAESVTDNQ